LKKRKEKASRIRKKAINTSQDVWVRSLGQEAKNQRLREPHKTRSAKRTKCSGAVERTKITRSAKNSRSAPPSSTAHPISSSSYNRPVWCCPPQLANWYREPGDASWPQRAPVSNLPGAGRKIQPGAGCNCCHGYHAYVYYLCNCTALIKLSYMQSDRQPKSYKWDETLNTTPTNIWATRTPGVCRPLPPNHLIPTKNFSYIFSRWDVVSLSIHWVVQNTKQHPFLIHAGSVYVVMLNQWHGQFMWFPLGFVMWATVLRYLVVWPV